MVVFPNWSMDDAIHSHKSLTTGPHLLDLNYASNIPVAFFKHSDNITH